MTDTARVRFSGLSTEDFDIPDIGDQCTFTIKATCTTHTEQNMADEGIRRTVTLKLDRVVEGVTNAVDQPANGQLTLDADDGFDGGPEFDDGKG